MFLHTNKYRKENTALRANVKPDTIYVIPNAVDNDIFVPDFNKLQNRSKSKYLILKNYLNVKLYLNTISKIQSLSFTSYHRRFK